MKPKPLIPKGSTLKYISVAKDKSHVYLIYETTAPRSIKPNAERKASEVIIYGMSYEEFVKRYGELEE